MEGGGAGQAGVNGGGAKPAGVKESPKDGNVTGESNPDLRRDLKTSVRRCMDNEEKKRNNTPPATLPVRSNHIDKTRCNVGKPGQNNTNNTVTSTHATQKDVASRWVRLLAVEAMLLSVTEFPLACWCSSRRVGAAFGGSVALGHTLSSSGALGAQRGKVVSTNLD